MSRAFMKEREDEPEPSITAPERTHPNYITPAGLRALRVRLQRATEPRDVEQLNRAIDSAIVVGPPDNHDVIAFGATVHVAGEKLDRAFTIVGEDETDVAQGRIGYTSPLAEALIGARAGDTVVWHRPIGDLTLKVLGFSYDESDGAATGR